jgi:thiol-disulfide isomerase/thioredoxin
MSETLNLVDVTPYKDLRREFFANYFNKALPYSNYGTSSPYWPKWERYSKLVELNSAQLKTIQNFKRKLKVLVLSGVWCGDCQRQGPILEAISRESSLIDLRFIESRENSDLQDELRINGAEKVPVVVFLSEDFLELERFGDRHLSVYRRLADEDTGAYCETGIGNPEVVFLKEETNEWVTTFERVQYILKLSPFLKRKYNE